MKGIVYDSPGEGFPFIAVVFSSDGRILVARPVKDKQVGELEILEIFKDITGNAEGVPDMTYVN